jgi:hypothetical protein
VRPSSIHAVLFRIFVLKSDLLYLTYPHVFVLSKVNNPPELNDTELLENNVPSCRSMLSSGCKMKLYYPLYSGWSFPSMPHFFLTPTEACSWALSRFKRDGLSNIWGNGIYPEFIKFVGVIVTDNKSFTECAKNNLFSSKKEQYFFNGCKFLQLLSTDNSILSYEQIDITQFSKLSDNLFHPSVDYQMSTNSTYRIGVTALSCPITNTCYENNNQIWVMQVTSPDNII